MLIPDVSLKMARRAGERNDRGADTLLTEFASLKKRLLETERRLKSDETRQGSPERSQALSLSDLTPSPRHEKQTEWTDVTNKRGIFSEQPVGSDSSSLRRKLAMLRQENCQLFSQNHSLLSELEDTSYQLLQSQNRVSEMSNQQPALREHLVRLESTITTQDRQIK